MLVEGFDEEFTPRDAGLVLLKDINLELQIVAIADLLKLTRVAKGELAAKMTEIEQLAKSATGDLDERSSYTLNDYYVDLWGEHFYMSVYQDAAHSMAAVGMLAPMAESLFAHGFRRIGEELFDDASNLPESKRAEGASSQFWDCHRFFNRGEWHTDLTKGILQLATACGLDNHLPSDTKHVLGALFAYRNKMFHNGFEWPIEERDKFAARLRRDWPEHWFSKATSGGNPWIFYMTREFIELLLSRIGDWIEAFGQLYLSSFPESPRSKP